MKGILVGYVPNGYKVWMPETCKFISARDVIIDEVSYLITRPKDHMQNENENYEWLKDVNKINKLNETDKVRSEKLNEIDKVRSEKLNETDKVRSEKLNETDKVRSDEINETDKERSDEINEINETNETDKVRSDEINEINETNETDKVRSEKLNETDKVRSDEINETDEVKSSKTKIDKIKDEDQRKRINESNIDELNSNYGKRGELGKERQKEK